MIYGPANTVTDPVTGAVMPDPAGGTEPIFQASLEAMTADLHSAYFGLAASNPDFAGVAPVGDAFLRAVQSGMATRNPYAPDALSDRLIDLLLRPALISEPCTDLFEDRQGNVSWVGLVGDGARGSMGQRADGAG